MHFMLFEVDGDRLYVLTEQGDLACLKAADGTVVWQRNILKDFGGRNIQWLVSESPLVDGDHVIVTPGGRGAGMVALNKMTGATVWTSKELNDEAGYSSSGSRYSFGRWCAMPLWQSMQVLPSSFAVMCRV